MACRFLRWSVHFRLRYDANAGSFSHAGGFQQAPAPTPAADAGDGFMNIPDGIDEELPFN